jgi:hypothetical protein
MGRMLDGAATRLLFDFSAQNNACCLQAGVWTMELYKMMLGSLLVDQAASILSRLIIPHQRKQQTSAGLRGLENS